jgi:transposase
VSEGESFWTYRRIPEVDGEIVARVERRRQWTLEEKAALMAEVEAAGGQVSVVARRHGISKSLLYNWRSAWRAAAGAVAARATSAVSAGFIQLGVVAEPTEQLALPASAACPRGAGLSLAERVGVIEIDLSDGVRVRVDDHVSERALRRVLAAVKAAG